MGYLSMMGFYNLPDDYLQNFVKNVESVTPVSAKDAMARRIKIDRLVTVIVGDIGADEAVVEQKSEK